MTLTAVEFAELTPEEREAMTAAWYAETVATPEPPPAPPPPEPAVLTQDVEVLAARDLRFVGWLDSLFSLGSRDGIRAESGQRLWLWRRFLVWLIRVWPRFRRMWSIVLSGPADESVFDIRSEICNECPSIRIGVRNGEAYCAACNCPDWALSKLRNKNRKRFNHCPQKRHPGGYIKLVTHTYPNRQARKPGGCGA